MLIVSMHNFDPQHLTNVVDDVKRYGHVTLRVYYDEPMKMVYLLEGNHRIEAAKLAGVPVELITMELDDVIDDHDIQDLPSPCTVAELVDYGYGDGKYCRAYYEDEFVSVTLR